MDFYFKIFAREETPQIPISHYWPKHQYRITIKPCCCFLQKFFFFGLCDNHSFVWCIWYVMRWTTLHFIAHNDSQKKKIYLLIYIFAWVTILSYFRLIFPLLLIPFNFCNNNNHFTSLIRSTQRANFRQYKNFHL